MITNSRKYIKKNSVENFKYDAIYLYDSYCTLVNEALASKIAIFGMQKCLSTSTFSEDIKECRSRLTILRSSGPSKSQEKQQLKQHIRAFLDKQNSIKVAFIQTEFEIFEQLSQDAVLQSRKHSCNMIFYNNVLKKRQEIINYFGIDFMTAEDDNNNMLTE